MSSGLRWGCETFRILKESDGNERKMIVGPQNAFQQSFRWLSPPGFHLLTS